MDIIYIGTNDIVKKGDNVKWSKVNGFRLDDDAYTLVKRMECSESYWRKSKLVQESPVTLSRIPWDLYH